MGGIKSTLAALFTATGMVLGCASGASAVTYNTLASFNAAVDGTFAITGTDINNVPVNANLIGFFGACGFLGDSNFCDANDGQGPYAANSSPEATQAFINANATFADITLVDKNDNPPNITTTGGVDVTFTTVPYALWVLKADNFLITLLFDQAITSLGFSGLAAGLSHIDFGVPGAVPLPPAVLLFGTALVAMGVVRRRRSKQLAAV
jgi:hypothetical protein